MMVDDTPFSLNKINIFGKSLDEVTHHPRVNILMWNIPSVTQKKVQNFFCNFQGQSRKIKT